MPWWINAFFSGITPFMDPITRDKIRFNPKLTELVAPDQLDRDFGGDYNFEFNHTTYWKTLTEFCHVAEDGGRVDNKGEKFIPASGNGIVWALQQHEAGPSVTSAVPTATTTAAAPVEATNGIVANGTAVGEDSRTLPSSNDTASIEKGIANVAIEDTTLAEPTVPGPPLPQTVQS